MQQEIAEGYRDKFGLPFLPTVTRVAYRELKAMRDLDGVLWKQSEPVGVHFYGPDDLYAFHDFATKQTEVI